MRFASIPWASLFHLEELEKLNTRLENNPQYEREMPQETALLYRLYAGSMLSESMSRNPSGNFRPYLQRAARFIEKSYNLNRSVWEKPYERSSYELLRAVARQNKSPRLDEFIRALYSLNMVKADESEVREKAQQTIDIVMQLALGPKRDFDYFKQFRGSSSKFTYASLLETMRIMVVGQGGRFDGPLFLPEDTRGTLVRYRSAPRGKPEVLLEWVVDSPSERIEPKTPLAMELHKLLVEGTENPPVP